MDALVNSYISGCVPSTVCKSERRFSRRPSYNAYFCSRALDCLSILKSRAVVFTEAIAISVAFVLFFRTDVQLCPLWQPPPPAARIRESGVRISASTPALQVYHKNVFLAPRSPPPFRVAECSDVLANFVTPVSGC